MSALRAPSTSAIRSGRTKHQLRQTNACRRLGSAEGKRRGLRPLGRSFRAERGWLRRLGSTWGGPRPARQAPERRPPAPSSVVWRNSRRLMQTGGTWFYGFQDRIGHGARVRRPVPLKGRLVGNPQTIEFAGATRGCVNGDVARVLKARGRPRCGDLQGPAGSIPVHNNPGRLERASRRDSAGGIWEGTSNESNWAPNTTSELPALTW